MKWWLRESFCQGKQVQGSWKRGARGPAESEAHHLLGSWLWAVQTLMTGNSDAMVLQERPARKLEAMDLGFLGAESWICHGKGRELEAGVPEKALFSSTGTNWIIFVPQAWGCRAEEARELCSCSWRPRVNGSGPESVCVCAKLLQSCLTLTIPWPVAYQAPLFTGILQARILE